MRFTLGCALLCGQVLFSCSNGHENTAKLTDYVGDEKFVTTYHDQRIYVVSPHQELQRPQLWRNGFLSPLKATSQKGSSNKAWYSEQFNAKLNEVIHLTTAIGEEKISRAFKIIAKDGVFKMQRMELSQVPLPTLRMVPGNQVDIEKFMATFNNYRARYGLKPVKYSHGLSEDAARNNQLQRSYGLGHHFMGRASAQNSAVGYGSIQSVMNGWHNSSGHRANMQQRRWSCMGIHWSGRYWTQNFSARKDCQ